MRLKAGCCRASLFGWTSKASPKARISRHRRLLQRVVLRRSRFAGYVPGVTIGYDVWMTEDELFFDLKTPHYWRRMAHFPTVSHRGLSNFQSIKNPNTPAEL